VVREAANHLASVLRNQLGKRVNGPVIPLIGRIQNLFLMNILIKLEKEVSHSKVKEMIINETGALLRMEEFRNVHFVFDVDPL
ncbi:MAG: primosomal protein N', partial [Bacteroidia bacterium]|nr:primosomal protein N' [Bacteroidia bacterium]